MTAKGNMEHDQHQANKAKTIAWCIAIAAVAIVYIVMNSRSSANTAALDRAGDSSNIAAPTQPPSSPTSGSSIGMSGKDIYKDGTYAATGSYRTPQSTESIDVNLTVANGTVTKASVQQNPTNRDSAEYQSVFQQSYQPYVVGKKLSDINLSRVSGSSLTSIGFNQALDQIKTQAQS